MNQESQDLQSLRATLRRGLYAGAFTVPTVTSTMLVLGGASILRGWGGEGGALKGGGIPVAQWCY